MPERGFDVFRREAGEYFSAQKIYFNYSLV